MRNKLEQFREVLGASKTNALASLRPGLSRDHVEDRILQLPFKITPDAIELYMWADCTFENPVEILPGAYFMGLDETLSEFQQIAPLRHELENISPQQYRDCFRFLSDFSDGGYAFGRIDSASEGRIIDLCIHDEWRLAFESLDKLIDTAIECRRSGVFRDGDIPDFKLYWSIGRELNPGMDTWEQYAV